MNDFITELTLDLNCSPKIQLVSLGQYDKGRKYSITVTANGKEFDISDCTAVFKGVRSDRTHFAVDCEIVDNKVIVTTDDTTLNVRGKSIARIVLVDSTRSYSTQSFMIDVASALEGDINEKEEV